MPREELPPRNRTLLRDALGYKPEAGTEPIFQGFKQCRTLLGMLSCTKFNARPKSRIAYAADGCDQDGVRWPHKA